MGMAPPQVLGTTCSTRCGVVGSEKRQEVSRTPSYDIDDEVRQHVDV